jgi:hypothetical protein
MSIHVSGSVFRSEQGRNLSAFRIKDVGWTRSRHWRGGDSTGSFSLSPDDADLFQAFRTWLGFDVREGEVPKSWGGFIWSMTYHKEGTSRTVSYDNLYNAIAVEYGNILTNGGFETAGGGGADVIAGWNEDAGTGGTISQETSAVNSGGNSLKLENGTVDDCNIYQDVTVAGGEKFRLSFYSQINSGGAGRYLVYDVTNTTLIISKKSTGHTDAGWVMTEESFSVPTTCLSLRIQFYPGSGTGSPGDSCFFDDVVLQQLDNQGNELPLITPWATNTYSIARYGRRELIINKQDLGRGLAILHGDIQLKLNAWPAYPGFASTRLNPAGGNDEERLDIEVVGYWATAFFRYVTYDTYNSSVNADVAIDGILDADCDWLDNRYTQTNSAGVLVDPTNRRRAGEVLEEILDMGDGVDLFTIRVKAYDGRKTLYWQPDISTPVLYRIGGKYHTTPSGPETDARHIGGGGVVVRDLDFPSSQRHYNGMLVNLQDTIIEEIEIDADDNVTITGR